MCFTEDPKLEKQDTFVEKLVTQVIKNVQVKISNIHVRYEDDVSISLKHHSCTQKFQSKIYHQASVRLTSLHFLFSGHQPKLSSVIRSVTQKPQPPCTDTLYI